MSFIDLSERDIEEDLFSSSFFLADYDAAEFRKI
jgi:hypothetical protein